MASSVAFLMLIVGMGIAEAGKPSKDEEKEASSCSASPGAFIVAETEESDKQKPPGLRGREQPKGQKEEDCEIGALPQSKDD